jgi:hypothetical protein
MHCDSSGTDQLDIPPTPEEIQSTDISAHHSVREILFGPNSRCGKIDGFSDFLSFSRIIIPSFVEFISFNGFWLCTSLNEVVFESGNHAKVVNGCQKCASLCQMIVQEPKLAALPRFNRS